MAELAAQAKERAMSSAEQLRNDIRVRAGGHLALARDGDPDALNEAGWALVLPADSDQARRNAIKDALQPLLDRRRRQVDNSRYKELLCAPAWTTDEFLGTHGAGPGSAEPDKVPYYVLLVGSPEEIPFSVQYDLGVQYAVGRLHFADLDGYRRYAEGVVRAEREGRTDEPSAAFFGVDGDRSTQRSATELVAPLADLAAAHRPPPWRVSRYVGAQATKQRLKRLLGGDDTPWLLFTASHGLGLFRESDSERQRRVHGALVCQDWPGRGAPTREQFFAAEDLASDVDLRGLIGFHFACFGAGTPVYNSFHDYDRLLSRHLETGERVTDRPFVARLPMSMLERGALAVIGHVDRAWSVAFSWKDPSGRDFRYTTTFEDVVSRLLRGRRAGYAMEYFGLLGATLGARIAALQRDLRNPMASPVSDAQWAYSFLCWHNARNHILLGDPAVRLPVHGPEKAAAP